MIIPDHWAEARVQARQGAKRFTVRRFGWSNESVQDAQRMAQERADAALARLLGGEALPRFEPRRAYNGAEGVPIREEVLARHGDHVITRNIYGAPCLNTPDVLFADIDFAEGPPLAISLLAAALLALLGYAIGGWLHGPTLAWLMAGAAALLGGFVAHLLLPLLVDALGGAEALALRRLRRALAQRPGWRVRVYRTPNGLRLLALHRRFRPDEAEVESLFRALRVDPRYARMCRRQGCFRARLGPKPWRIGLGGARRLRRVVWPVTAEQLDQRRQWVADYEAQSAGYAACRYLETLGDGRIDAEADRVRDLHDRLSAAESGRPIA